MPELTWKPELHGLAKAIAEQCAPREKRPPLRVIEALLTEHWLMVPQELERMLQIALRLNADPETIAAELGRPLANTAKTSIVDGTAVVPINGPIFKRANMFTELSGATSVELIARDIKAADENDAVSQIVLEIDSPGGQAAGIADVASIIAGTKKRTIAYIDSQAASAAYWLASATNEIVISRAAMVGNVGVVVTASTKKDKDKIEIISSQSPLKRPDLSTESGREHVQGLVDDLAQVFINDVAQLRGIDVERVLSWKGAILVGQKAIDAGMADRVGTFESIIAGDSGVSIGGYSMTAKQSPPDITAEYISAEFPAVADQFRAEGREAAEIELQEKYSGNADKAAADERSRIQAVLAQGANLPGFESLVNTMAFDGKTTGPEAALALLEANANRTAKASQDIVEETPEPVATVTEERAPKSKQDDGRTAEVRAREEWETNAEIRNEFSDVEQFIAYKTAEESGRVRRLGGVK